MNLINKAMRAVNQIVVLSLIGILVLGLSRPVDAKYSKRRPEGTLTSVIGQVDIKRDEADWTQIKAGEFLFPGDKIRSSKNGVGEIAFRDGSLVRITRNSYMEILPREKRDKKWVRRLAINSGKLWAKVIKGNPMDVESDVAICSVKGTEFFAELESEQFSLYVLEGLVELANKYGKVAVSQNEKAKTTKTAPPKKRLLQRSEQDKLKKEIKIKTEHILTYRIKGNKFEEGEKIPVELKLINKSTNKRDKYATKTINIRSESGDCQVSRAKNGFRGNAAINLINGQGRFFIRPKKAGEYKIFASGENLEPISLMLKVKESKKAKLKATKQEDGAGKRTAKERATETVKGTIFIDGQPYSIEVILEKR